MPSFSLPASRLKEISAAPARTVPLPAPVLPSQQPDHPPSPPSSAGKPSAWKAALAVLARLRASFARSEAVHQARLDTFWNGPERYLLVRYTCSVK